MSRRRDQLRAADIDRTFVADLLKRAVDEGRLSLFEYDERLQRTYQARTYGELDQVIADLPRSSRRALTPVSQPADQPSWEPKPERSRSNWLRVLWTVWAVLVAVDVVVWIIVCATLGEFVYPWPVWVGGPLGAALLAITLMRGDRGKRNP